MSDTKRKEVYDIISEMLDNPDDCGIYGTTKAFESLGELLDEHAKEVKAEQRQMCADDARKALTKWKAVTPTGTADIVENACLNATGESDESQN